VVTLGHAARNQAGIKVRQPLALAVVKPRSEAEINGLWSLADQIRDELNVHELEITLDEFDLVDYRIDAVPSQVGKKYKALFPAIREALSKLDWRAALAAAEKVRAGEPLRLTVHDQGVTLLPEDVQVQTTVREGFAVAEDGGYMVSLWTLMREDLKREGLARDIVRRIQTMRKEAGFRIQDTITTWYQGSESLAPVFDEWGKYIRQETLSKRLLAKEPPKDAFVDSFELDGQPLTLGVRRSRARRGARREQR